MFQGISTWTAAHSDFVAAVFFTVVAVTVCCLVFPQDGSGGDFDFGGDGGGE
jgi:hypothetical protein